MLSLPRQHRIEDRRQIQEDWEHGRELVWFLERPELKNKGLLYNVEEFRWLLALVGKPRNVQDVTAMAPPVGPSEWYYRLDNLTPMQGIQDSLSLLGYLSHSNICDFLQARGRRLFYKKDNHGTMGLGFDSSGDYYRFVYLPQKHTPSALLSVGFRQVRGPLKSL